jgi:hypothetical protein
LDLFWIGLVVKNFGRLDNRPEELAELLVRQFLGVVFVLCLFGHGMTAPSWKKRKSGFGGRLDLKQVPPQSL